MKIFFFVFSMFVLVAFPIIAIATDEASDEASIDKIKEGKLEHIDSMIENLNQFKICIQSAQSKADLRRCEKNRKDEAKRKRLDRIQKQKQKLEERMKKLEAQEQKLKNKSD